MPGRIVSPGRMWGSAWIPLRALLFALVLGAGGGMVFVWVGMPLPWMLGAVLATMIAAFSGAPIGVPNVFRNSMLVVLGVLIGSGFTPEILSLLPRWAISITGVLGFTILLVPLSYWFFRRVVGYRKVDAFFAGLPGGLAAVIFIGAEVGADLRKLSVIHSTRIVVVCFVIPVWIRLTDGTVRSVTAMPRFQGGLEGRDALVLVACGLVGYFVAARLRLPAPFMLGPLFFSAAAHMMGWTAAKPPVLLVVAAQVVVGSAIGCRFVGVSVRQVLGSVALGLVIAVVMLIGAFGMAFGLHKLTGLPFNAMLLALAPGGLPEMTLIALSLDIDLALVVSHHLARVLFINLAVPILARIVLRPEDMAGPQPGD